MTSGTSSSRTRWFTDLPFFLLKDRSFVTLLLGMISRFFLLCLGSICQLGILLHLWGSRCISTWVGFHILIPHLVPWYWWRVGVLFQKESTCNSLSKFSRLGLIFEFLCQVVWGSSHFLLHVWLRISCRLYGVLGEVKVDVRVVVLNRSWC